VTFDDTEEWLIAFREAPLPRLEALLGGWDRIAPYFRTDGAELLAYLLPRPDAPGAEADHALVDQALRDWFTHRLAAPLPGPEQWNSAATEAAQAIALVAVLPVRETAAWLLARWGEATAWAEAHSRTSSPDLRAALWRALARHQTDRRLAARWRELCAQVGRGSMPAPYLDIALMGLMALPRAAADAPRPSDDVLMGLVTWARRQPNNPAGRSAFQREWRALSTLYPRGPDYWQARLTGLLDAEPCRYLAGWWADEIGLAAPAAAPSAPPPVPRRPPTTSPPQAHAIADAILKAPTAEAERRFAAFVADFEAFTDAALDAHNLTRSFDIVGNRLLAAHPSMALHLARAAIARDRNHQHSWLLWSRALLRLGHRDLAETVLWEAERSVPENGVPASALAQLLAETNRNAEAEALYRRAMQRFPDNVVTPNALAHLLASAGRTAEAEALYRLTMQRFPDNAVAPNALARLLATAGRTVEAEALYRSTMQRLHRDAVSRLDLGLLLLNLGRPDEVEPILDQLQTLKATEARTLAAHLTAVRAGRPRPRSTPDLTPSPADLPPGPQGDDWAELRALAEATRAGFLLSPALDQPTLLLVTADDRTRLRREARDALARLNTSHGNHPLVRLLAWRHGLASGAMPALPEAAEGDFALRVAMAVQRDTATDFPALLGDPRFAELRPVAAFAWLLIDDPGATPAARVMLQWLPQPQEPHAEPVLRDLHGRLTKLISAGALRGMTQDDFLDIWSEIFPGVASDLRLVLDLALLALVERELPHAALAWEPESALT
jgi:Flp pilus assembly protein TadD